MLPECLDDNAGETFYVLDEEVFKYCAADSEWTEIDLKGTNVLAGESVAGPAGKDGVNGSGVAFALYKDSGVRFGYVVDGAFFSEEIVVYILDG